MKERKNFGCGNYEIGIYVRESRDDNEENYDTIETQRDLLIDYVNRTGLGNIKEIYMDDNVSGSAFERPGLEKLKEDVEKGRINLVLLKDLSRLGRNNAKTLLFLDYLEEKGVRVLTFDGRYDSISDNDTVGIETWANERYIRDISRKIRASLRYKISRGDYIGSAPFGYKKSSTEKNRLCIDEEKAEIVRQIFRLYRKGYGYSSVAKLLEEKGLRAPGGGSSWSSIAVRRILDNRVYTGDTVQGVSEKISYKSKKTRRLPPTEWTITPGTHEAIISKEEFLEAQRLRQQRKRGASPHKNTLHVFRDLLECGRCGSRLYARRKKGSDIFYVCSRYYKHGASACTSHLVYEGQLLEAIRQEVKRLFENPDLLRELENLAAQECAFGVDIKTKLARLEQQLNQKMKQQEILYNDRLEERISPLLFEKMNRQLEERISVIRGEIEILKARVQEGNDSQELIRRLISDFESIKPTNEMMKCLVNKIIIFDSGDPPPDGMSGMTGCDSSDENGKIVIELKVNNL